MPNLLDNLILQKLPIFHKRFKPQKTTFTLKSSTFYGICCHIMSDCGAYSTNLLFINSTKIRLYAIIIQKIKSKGEFL
nr:MAG TPA: hypothetical protein [Caudoviricetes sp.]